MMKNRRKGILFLTISALLCTLFFCGISYAAPEDQQRVFDQAGLLTEDQITDLESQIKSAIESMKMDMVIVTTADAGGKSAMAFADDFYDNSNFGTGNALSGVLLLIDMDNREVHISTDGDMIRFITDERREGERESLLDQIYPYVADENYYQAALTFISETEGLVRSGIEPGQYDYDTETGKKSRRREISFLEAVVAFLMSAGCGGVTCMTIVNQYKMKKQSRQSAGYNLAYRATSEMAFHSKNDVMANSFVTQRIIPRIDKTGPPGSSGGSFAGRSSTHTSSAGRTHGGGGRKF